ncbi:hypothetical protein EW145_g4398 [Phellinidium pouzarii]|uniref:Uncharacterized protein n=1 Tax=Phellinidium pouzarii TaxID=167371 RepID=A0A4S4L3M2_9AGAM|nr:hypothetical protein EW145_g4398 [Phellinidium pouzarii]
MRLGLHRRVKSDSSLDSLRSLSTSTLSYDSRSPTAHFAHTNLTTEDISSLLSRMACLEAELNEVTSCTPSSKQRASFSKFCFPSSRVLLQKSTTMQRPLSPCVCEKSKSGLLKPRMLVPSMKTIVEKPTSPGTMDDLGVTLLLGIDNSVHDTSKSSEKMLCIPCVSDSRTPEHYIALLDIAVNARKESRCLRKIVKFWKNFAIQNYTSGLYKADIPLTPSPSDISETGLSEVLSFSREERMKDLMAKRGTVFPIVDEEHMQPYDQELTASKELPKLPLKPDQSDSLISLSSISTSWGHSSSASPEMSSEMSSLDASDDEQTLIEHKIDVMSEPSTPPKKPFHFAKKTVALTSPEQIHPASSLSPSPTVSHLPATNLSSLLSSPQPSRKPLEHHHNRYTKPIPASLDMRISNIPFASVRSKRRMYESLETSTAHASHTLLSSTTGLSQRPLPVTCIKSESLFEKPPSHSSSRVQHDTKSYTSKLIPKNSGKIGCGRSGPKLKSLALPQARRNVVPSSLYSVRTPPATATNGISCIGFTMPIQGVHGLPAR